MTEIELAKAAAGGDRDAFCGLYDKYKTRLYRYAYYRLGDQADAEDAVSSCVLSAWEQIGKLREPAAFPAWIFRILRASCAAEIKNEIRQRNELSEDALDTMPDNSGAESREGAEPDTHIMLMEALDTLEKESREMVLLSVVGGLTSNEIGELFDMPPGTVRSRLSRSLKAMRKALEAEDE